MMEPATKALNYNQVIVPGIPTDVGTRTSTPWLLANLDLVPAIPTDVGTRPSTPWLLSNSDLVPGTGLEPARPCGH